MNDQISTSRSKKIIYCSILTCIILLQTLICVHYGVLKKGFFVDELWGAGLANSFYRPRLFTPDVFNTNTYLPGSFFNDYLTVSPDEGFSIASVWYNQSQDSHPPLYFLIYHALSCLELGIFSKWTGFVINLFFLICSDIFIFLMTKKLTGYAEAGLVAAALWGSSAEAVSYVLCARMYMMAAFFAVLFVYKSLLFYEPLDEPNRKDILCLLLAATGGCLTHYYFYIAAFAMAALTCIYLFLERGFRSACKYALYVLGGVVLAWAIYPYIFESLAHGDGRGREAVRNILDIGSLWSRIGKLFDQIEIKLLYKPILIVAILASSLIIVTVVLSHLWRNRIDSTLSSRINMLLMTEMTLCLYLLAVAKLQPYNTNRYYFPITTLLWIVVIGNAVLFIRVLMIRCKAVATTERMAVLAITLVLTAVAGVGVVKSHLDHKVMYLFPRQEKVLTQIQQLDEPSAICVTLGDRYTLTVHCLELSYCRETLCIDIEDSESDVMNYQIHDEGDSCVVYVSDRLNQEKLLNQILEQTSYSSYKLIGRGSGIWWEDAKEHYIYVLSK